MKLFSTLTILFSGVLLFSACRGTVKSEKKENGSIMNDNKGTYGKNLEFLKKHTEVIELRKNNSAIAVIPSWQGRVMTSTSEGDLGFSFGWINHELISSGELKPHINAFGGEERLWFGPEGGQFSIFFKKDSEFTFDNWQTPAFMDTEPFRLIGHTDSTVTFSHNAEIENYSGTAFRFSLERKVELMGLVALADQAGIDVSGVSSVAYKSVNLITNTGDYAWTKETGLLSIWILGMFNPSPGVIVAIPYNKGDEAIMGVPVNDSYFGEISDDRLKVSDKHIFFRADGKSRGKIGLSPQRAKGIMASYDADNCILTFLICRLPEGNRDYVNSSWEIQDRPYSGDALNSYNDGPLEDGSQMGPFYELESSSPAAELKPGESIRHIQYTIHLTGSVKELDRICGSVIGIGLEEISNAFK
jgi:hypothetical protein